MQEEMLNCTVLFACGSASS